jgi:hypothetical protein
MKGKVNCTCGWSWNKSDSSKKDMYICHQCGRDNSNNMKNGGWLNDYNNISKAQEGEQISEPPKSQYKRLYGHAKDYSQGENEKMRIDPNTGYGYFPSELSTVQQKEVPDSPWNVSRFLFDPFIRNESQGVHNTKYDKEGKRIDTPIEEDYFSLGLNRRERYDAAKNDITNYYKEDLKLNDDEVEEKVDDAMDLIRKMRRTEEMMQRQNETYKNFQNPEEVFKRAVGFYGDDNEINPSEAKRAYKMFQKTWRGTPGKEARQNSREELKKAEEAFKLAKKQMKEGLPKPDPNYVPEDFANGGILKNGGWLDQYASGGTMQEYQENYNDSKATASPDMRGDGFSNVGRNYSPAWGGQFEDGGEIPNAQKGKKVKPLYVESKNDPRYKAYQDSLRLYKEGEKDINKYKEKIKYWHLPKESLWEEKGGYNPYEKIQPIKRFGYISDKKGNIVDKNTGKYIVLSSDNDNQFTFGDRGAGLEYKKPQQQVIVKEQEKRKPVKAIQNNIKPEGLIQSDTKLNTDIKGLKPTVKTPKYYNIQENINKPFGGSQTNYRSSDLKNITSPDDLGSGNTRKIVPHYAMGGSLPGSVGFTYARTKGIPSEGPYAKKTLPSAQNGVDMYDNPLIARMVNNTNIDRSYYDPRLNTMNMGSDYTTWKDEATGELLTEDDLEYHQDKMLAHENYHAIQHSQGRDNYDIAHNTDNRQWAEMQKRPELMSTDSVWNNFYNRGDFENQQDYQELINNFPESRILNQNLLFDKILDRQRYDNPSNAEGEAKFYEDTGVSFQNGGEMKFYQNGLDFKPKSISRNGGWLNKYEQAQEGTNLPSVRSLINDTMNRKIQANKGKDKETNATKKDNTKTVTPKEIKKLSGKQQNELALKQSEEQARKDWIQNSMEEAYKSPLMSPGYFTPEGVAIGALQGAAKLGPDLYEGNYKGAAMDALMALPISIPAAKKLLPRFTPKQNYTLPEPPLELNLNINEPRLNLERTVPKVKKVMPDYGKVDIGNDLILYNNPSRVIDESSILGKKQAIKSVRDNSSGKSIELKTFTDDNGNLKYYMSADMPNRIKAGRAFLELDKHIPIGAEIQEPGSLSFDSLLNVAKQSQSPKFASSVEGTVQLNDAAVFNKIKNKGDSALGNEYYSSLENANKGVEEVNTLLKKYNLPNAEAKQVVRNDGSLSNTYSIHVPSVTLKKLYSILGISTIGAASQMQDEESIPGMKKGGIIKDDRGQWKYPGEITEIGSNQITMQGVPYDVLGISDTGDTKLMKPGKNYKFKGKKVTEFPMAKNGRRQEQKGLVNLDDLTNFTNYNKQQPAGWLSKYN